MAVARIPFAPRDLRAQLGLSRERMGRVLGMSSKTVERWEAQDAAPRSERAVRRLAVLSELLRLGRVVYGDRLQAFLVTPLPEFGGRTALQLVEQDEGERVVAALAADYEGSVV